MYDFENNFQNVNETDTTTHSCEAENGIVYDEWGRKFYI